ncbi:hypothetical protein CBR_g991 [Chara braunii]|uniref:Myb-like domain-containing protein n=1 Tax=Chara braunii TaxID=69332 RepID=A0A388KCT4_CHABU|nr:hypothetical protein CBR_g991 [Chara braunii]|eukprot:GBG67872.1 hypothetical protein CBR_g991 [Chara braunii]
MATAVDVWRRVAVTWTARADGGGAPAKRRTRPWPLEERLNLARFMKEDDAMMTIASGGLKHARRSVRNEWVSRKMREAGWIRSAEDCRKKRSDLMGKMKDILHKCNAPGKPSYWDMSVEDRKKEGIPTMFEQPLWEEMEWAHRKPFVICDNTMASSNCQGAESGVSDNRLAMALQKAGAGAVRPPKKTTACVRNGVGRREKTVLVTARRC